VFDLASLAASADGAARQAARLSEPSFEHLALGVSWVLARKPELALYELDRIRAGALTDPESAVAELARARALLDADLPRLALDDVARAERGAAALLRALDAGSFDRAPVAPEKLTRVALALLRFQALSAVGRGEEAVHAMDGVGEEMRQIEGMSVVFHLLLARKHLNELDLKQAATEVRAAATSCTQDREMKALLDKLVGDMDAAARSVEPAELMHLAARAASQRLLDGTLAAAVRGWSEVVRQRAAAQVESWRAALPDAEQLGAGITGRARGAVQLMREAVGGSSPPGSPSPSPPARKIR
jgi:hypothetical protein